ncbi:hypothetical protein BS17DRAFT_765744 [Gyrodon lividus]|nr:hypothetical protein BS17DRAFT_765744 [Gyrodon lividus]
MKKYLKNFSEFDVAQYLFKKQADQYDKNKGRNPSDPSSIGKRTKNVREWFKTMCKEDSQMMAKVAESKAKWMAQGPPRIVKSFLTIAKLLSHRKKNLAKRILEFQEELDITMGVHCVIFHGHHSAEGGVEVGILETVPKQQGVKFKQHLSGRKNCDKLDFPAISLKLSTNEDGISGSKGEKVDLKKSEAGYLILPDRSALKLPGQKDVIRQIMNKAYVKYTNNCHACVPWTFLVTALLDYLDEECLPEGLDTFPDPSKLTGTQVQDIWNCWLTRQKRGEAMVVFTASKKGDLRAEVEQKQLRRKKGKKYYVEISSEGEGEAEQPVLLQTIGGETNPMPQMANYEAESLAAHSSDRATQLAFLYSLSKALAYQGLVLQYSEMKTTPCPEPPLSLESWCSWEWTESSLPAELHNRATGSYPDLNFECSGCYSFEYKVIELEPDTDPIPPHLGHSPFSHKHLDQVLKLVEEARDRMAVVISGNKKSSKSGAGEWSDSTSLAQPQKKLIGGTSDQQKTDRLTSAKPALAAPEGLPTTVPTNSPAVQQEGSLNTPAELQEKRVRENGEEDGSLLRKKPWSRAHAATPALEVAHPK